MKLPIPVHATAFAVLALSSLPTLAAVAQDSGPTLKSTWKSEVAADSRRLAVADMAGDSKLNLLLLGKDGALTIHTLAGAAPVKMDTVELGKGIEGFAALKPGMGKSSLVAIPGAVFYRAGDKYVRKNVGEVGDITGTVRFTDGTENYFHFAGMGEPESHGLDLTAEKPVTAGKAMPSPDMGEGVYESVVAHFGADVFDHLGLPMEARKAGVFGFFATKPGGKLYGCIAWDSKDESYVALAEFANIIGGGSSFKPAWRSPKFPGRILDFTVAGDPKTGKGTGVYVLTETGADGKGRQVEYFAVEKP